MKWVTYSKCWLKIVLESTTQISNELDPHSWGRLWQCLVRSIQGDSLRQFWQLFFIGYWKFYLSLPEKGCHIDLYLRLISELFFFPKQIKVRKGKRNNKPDEDLWSRNLYLSSLMENFTYRSHLIFIDF